MSFHILKKYLFCLFLFVVFLFLLAFWYKVIQPAKLPLHEEEIQKLPHKYQSKNLQKANTRLE